MRKHFITGLIILLPLALTLAIVFFVINFLTQPFVIHLEHYFEQERWFTHFRVPVHYGLEIIFFLILFLFTVLLGFLTRHVFFKWLFSLQDYVLHRIPFIKTLYKASQQVIKSILGSSSSSFKQVVLVPFPKPESYSIGFIVSTAPTVCEKTVGTSLISVLVPTTPNPTSGLLILYPEKDILYIDMKIEDALKYIISCGVITEESPPVV